MDKTIKELADEIGVSKQALYKRIKREPLLTQLQTYVHTKGQTTYIDVYGQRLIITAFKEDHRVQEPSTYSDNHIQSDTVGMQSMIDLLSKQLEEKDQQILKLSDRLEEQSKSNENQLEKKDSQISELNQRLAESQELNRNQQVLLKNEQEKLLLLVENKAERRLLKRIFKKK